MLITCGEEENKQTNNNKTNTLSQITFINPAQTMTTTQ